MKRKTVLELDFILELGPTTSNETRLSGHLSSTQPIVGHFVFIGIVQYFIVLSSQSTPNHCKGCLSFKTYRKENVVGMAAHWVMVSNEARP